MEFEHRPFDHLLTEIFYSGLKAVDPYQCVLSYTGRIEPTLRRRQFDRLYSVAFGKAAVPMAKALAQFAGNAVSKGIIITKYGHSNSGNTTKNMRLFEAGHPIPDENGVAATAEVVRLMEAADESTLVIFLISGGGSALLVSPHAGITLAEKQEVTDLLLRAGANITELNAVRKHLSQVKGGRLTGIAYPARVISFILSDVIGDPLDVIASGPTSPDGTTYRDALEVLEKYRLTKSASDKVIEFLLRGAEGLLAETPKPGDPIFRKVENIIVGSNRKATEAAAQRAGQLGFDVTVLSNEIQGEAREAAISLARKTLQIKKTKAAVAPVCLIQGGETTVTVKGQGRGGRNAEFALSFAMEIEGIDGVSMLSAGTDGTDGPTDAAGAIADGGTAGRMRASGIDPAVCLRENDSYTCFQRAGGLFITGPTGTNVMDLQIVLIA